MCVRVRGILCVHISTNTYVYVCTYAYKHTYVYIFVAARVARGDCRSDMCVSHFARGTSAYIYTHKHIYVYVRFFA